jgi:iron complex transport system ATP-binding protein
MIKARNISFSYPGKPAIFKNHSFSVERGEIMAILGPNGRGKTTLLKCLMGMYSLREGIVVVDGTFGYVPQQAAAIFSYSVIDMVVMGRARHIPLFSSPKQKDFKLAEQILQKLDLMEFRDRCFIELSGGEKQLVLIARALASECNVLFLDEPTSALDFRNQDKVLRTIRHLGKEHDMTVLFSTHSPNQAVHVADKALLMFSPEQYEFGSVEEVMNDRNLKRLYGVEIKKIRYTHQCGCRNAIVPVFG